MSSDPQYPEHDKLAKVSEESQVIGQFLDEFLLSRYVLANYGTGEEWEDNVFCKDELYPARTTVEDLLAEYFGIDPVKLDQEKNQMLEEWRKRNENLPKPSVH